jgi:membrane-bound metal-dependent hydrolase YbcI (DUF457 family)
MHTTKHLVINLVLGGIILFLRGEPVFSLGLLLIVLAGGIIDFDHVFDEMRKGSWKHPGKMIKRWAATHNQYVQGLYAFHTGEFLLLMIILSFIFPILAYVFIGLVLHLFADGVTNYNDTKSFFWLKSYSALWWLTKKKANL